jgi:two-component system, OmpR family, response regulator QseB
LKQKYKSMRILLVEDDDRIADPLAEDLRHQSNAVDIAYDGLAAWEFAQAENYDVILLDWMLPKLDGIQLCQRLRQSGCQAYILLLTAKDATGDKVIGLDAGADDYLVKPFEVDELTARLRALSRRQPTYQSVVLKHREVELNPSSHSATYAGVELELTSKEYMLLEYFLLHPTQVISRIALLDRLWEFDRLSGEQTIKTHLTNLRRKLKQAGCTQDIIETVYGVGYRLGNG